jgi:hypothetical protein
MRTMPASGYNHHSSYPQGYLPWKGTGVFSNPVGITASHIRPLTNLDPGNAFPTGFGLPRPMKHYRKGRVVTHIPLIPGDPYNEYETNLINYNLNRLVKSSNGQSLGGGRGGFGLLSQMIDTPGSFTVKQNEPNEKNGVEQLDKDCKVCQGVGIVASYYPNTTYLTNNPEPNVTNKVLCCNEERKARRRVVYANTNLQKNYYTTTKQYLQNRCQTYQQKAFNFEKPNPVEIQAIYKNDPLATDLAIKYAKPGSPLALLNTYVANCFPNAEIDAATEIALLDKLFYIMVQKGILTPEQVEDFKKNAKYDFEALIYFLNSLPEAVKVIAIAEFEMFINNPYYGVPFSGPSKPFGCKLVVYKPNNYQFAKQGAVESSTRMLKLNVNTIETNAASFDKNAAGNYLTATDLAQGSDSRVPFILKNKAPVCNRADYFGNPFFFQGQHQNHKMCYLTQEYYTPNTPNILNQPTRFTNAQPAFSSNHFSQSPNTYNTTHR